MSRCGGGAARAAGGAERRGPATPAAAMYAAPLVKRQTGQRHTAVTHRGEHQSGVEPLGLIGGHRADLAV
ncbi:hypothetical protein, partial [Nocardia cyriacigeorgica]|uniref:hypothetical protein n=1 Tax=Nocardia cyriacigeorgica TaxID=135487 RepID=UPI002453D8B1